MRHSYMLGIALLAAAPLAAGQVTVFGAPRIDLIDFYGLNRVTPALARQALGLGPGAPLPVSKTEAEERLLDIDRIVAARLEAVCCDEGKNVLYVGVEERGARHYELRPAPGGAVRLPEEVRAAWRAYEQAARAAELAGKTGEDFARGHPLATDAATRRAQERFPALVDAHLEAIREVLRESGDEWDRMIAAALLPYASAKAEVVEDLRASLSDAEVRVRAQAVRGLVALAMLARNDPASRVRVSTLWFVELLDSIAWRDRMQAVWALEQLTRDRDVFTLALLRGDALRALIEMARWQLRTHAYPAFQLVGRVAGLEDREIRDAWLRAGRETVIARALEAAR
jgi:hypothetical protein